MHYHYAFHITFTSRRVEWVHGIEYSPVGEWVVSSKNGTEFKVKTHGGVN